jgi:DNA polymerase-3 subunit gamma/tau
MAYLSLYRKWRSQRFDELVGQDHISQTLKNSLRRKRIFPVYLFCGPRGTGKTSTARIFAKALNCAEGIVEEPCNKCGNCRDITLGSALDLIEIDAASNTGVDAMRDVVVEKASYQPVSGRYKVYIIDEVHMLSVSSFNALLKTLEEPPKNVVFVLATTDPQKVPATILSRAQRFDFRRISPKEILRRLRNISQDESYSAEEGALNLLAEMADGSLRDALVLLEQVAMYAGKSVTTEDVIGLLGITNDETLFDMAQFVKENDTFRSLEMINDLYAEGKDLLQLCKDFVRHFRNLMMIKVCRETPFLGITGEDRLKRLAAQADLFELPDIIRVLRLLMALAQELRQGYDAKILWEIHLIKLTHAQVDSSLESIDLRLRLLERRLKSGAQEEESRSPHTARALAEPAKARYSRREPAEIARDESGLSSDREQGDRVPPGRASETREPSEEPERERSRASSHGEQRGLPSLWHRLLQEVSKERPGLHSALANARPLRMKDERVHIGILKANSFDRSSIENNKSWLDEVLTRLNGTRLMLAIEILDSTAGKSPEYRAAVQEVMDGFEARIIDYT